MSQEWDWGFIIIAVLGVVATLVGTLLIIFLEVSYLEAKCNEYLSLIGGQYSYYSPLHPKKCVIGPIGSGTVIDDIDVAIAQTKLKQEKDRLEQEQRILLEKENSVLLRIDCNALASSEGYTQYDFRNYSEAYRKYYKYECWGITYRSQVLLADTIIDNSSLTL